MEVTEDHEFVGSNGSRLENIKAVKNFLVNPYSSDFLLVTGFPHIGKSTLLDEVLRQQQTTTPIVVIRDDYTDLTPPFAVAKAIEVELQKQGFNPIPAPIASTGSRPRVEKYIADLKNWMAQATPLLDKAFGQKPVIIWLCANTEGNAISAVAEMARKLRASGKNRKIVIEQRRDAYPKPVRPVRVLSFQPEEIEDMLLSIENRARVTLRDAVYKYYGTHPYIVSITCNSLRATYSSNRNIFNTSAASATELMVELNTLNREYLDPVLGDIMAHLSESALDKPNGHKIELNAAGLLVSAGKTLVATVAKEYVKRGQSSATAKTSHRSSKARMVAAEETLEIFRPPAAEGLVQNASYGKQERSPTETSALHPAISSLKAALRNHYAMVAKAGVPPLLKKFYEKVIPDLQNLYLHCASKPLELLENTNGNYESELEDALNLIEEACHGGI